MSYTALHWGNKRFSLDGNHSVHLTGTHRGEIGALGWYLPATSRSLLFTSASVLQPLPDSLWHSPRKHRCEWGLTQMALVMLEGRRWSQLADGSSTGRAQPPQMLEEKV